MILTFTKMPNIKFGRKLTIIPTKDDVEEEEEKDDEIEFIKHVQEASSKVVIKEDEDEKKVSLSFRQPPKKFRKVKQEISNDDDDQDKIVEEKVAKYLEGLKKQLMEAMSEREEKVIKIIKAKDIELSKMKFYQECQALEWSEKAELFKKEATVSEELIKKLEKKNKELTKEQKHREDSLMKLRDQIYLLSSENEKFKQMSDQMDSLRAEAEVNQDEGKKQAERLQGLQTELEACQEQLRKRAEENKQILQDSARKAETIAAENLSKLNQELAEKEGLLADWKRKVEQKERELSSVQEQLHSEKKNSANELERKERIHKKEMKSRVELSNKTIEELRKQLDKAGQQGSLRDLVLKTKEKEQTEKQKEEVPIKDSNPKCMEEEQKEKQREDEKQTQVGNRNSRDPRIKKGQLRKTSVEPKNYDSFELKKNNSFFASGSKYKTDDQNPFDQRPFHAKRKDYDYQRPNERKEEVIRKLPSDKWKYDRDPRYNNWHYQRAKPSQPGYYRTWSN